MYKTINNNKKKKDEMNFSIKCKKLFQKKQKKIIYKASRCCSKIEFIILR
jgi:hypothetical protein